MLFTFLLFLLLSNGLNTKPDIAILYSRTGFIIIIYIIISCLNSFFITYLDKGIGIYGGLFGTSCISHNFQIFTCIICSTIILMTGFYPRKRYFELSNTLLESVTKKVNQYSNIINKALEQFTIIEYALVILFVLTGALLLLISADLASIYLSIELQSFSLYIISSLHRNSESSTGSALTYFLLGGLSSCFILLGIALIYTNSSTSNLDNVYSLITDSNLTYYNSDWYIPNYIFYSFLLMSIGFLFKIAAAPFHWWSPDVYDGVPTVVTAFIAIIGKIAILILFVELVHYTSTLLYSTIQLYSWTISITISCFLSLVIGTLLGLTQIRIKRLLAYSTISHIGFILLSLTVHSIESDQALLFYIFQYIITNMNVFFILIAIGFSLYLYYSNVFEFNNLIEKNNSPIQLISQLKGYFSINPLLSLSLIITIFSFIGLPPLIGFFAKQMTLTAALDHNKEILVITAILSSVIGAVYYLYIIKTTYFEKTDYLRPHTINISVANIYSNVISIVSLITILFILIPDQILNLCSILSDIGYANR